MVQIPPSDRLWIGAALAIMLLMTTRIQNCYSQRTNWAGACQNISGYYASYDNIDPGLKVLDAINAQRSYIGSSDIGVRNQFEPYLPGGVKRNNAVVKSLIELIRMKEKYEALGAMNQAPQHALAKILYGKLTEETCLWLNKSPDIDIPDCTNIDVSNLEQLYFRMELHDALKTTKSDVEETISPVVKLPTHPIYYCAWMNDRILDNCADESSNYNNHRNTLNNLCTTSFARNGCSDIQLCPIAT